MANHKNNQNDDQTNNIFDFYRFDLNDASPGDYVYQHSYYENVNPPPYQQPYQKSFSSLLNQHTNPSLNTPNNLNVTTPPERNYQNFQQYPYQPYLSQMKHQRPSQVPSHLPLHHDMHP